MNLKKSIRLFTLMWTVIQLGRFFSVSLILVCLSSRFPLLLSFLINIVKIIILQAGLRSCDLLDAVINFLNSYNLAFGTAALWLEVGCPSSMSSHSVMPCYSYSLCYSNRFVHLVSLLA